MRSRAAILWGFGVGVLWLGASARSEAQGTSMGSAGGVSSSAMSMAAANAGVNTPYTGPVGFGAVPFTNPYTSPYANPYMSPFMLGGSTPAQQQTALGLYMMNSVQNGNGIGSGKLGGPRATTPGRKPLTRATAAAPTESYSPFAAANTPGGVASRYFSRTNPMKSGAVRYFNRPAPH